LRLLLDSHILVWWMNDDARLGGARRRAIASAEVYFSPLSAWELGLKILGGRLDLGGRSPVADWIGEGFEELAFTAAHAEAALELPPIHRDPVDRFLVAQALVEGLTLATDDETIRRYPVPVL
jgi:PIN domain nuclease of toxin-antitoxin system